MESLVWVVVDGAARHVSAFAHLAPRDRPRPTCPQCDRPLTLKLGPVRRHHAAHAVGDVCAATQPETALHINCKLALAEALRVARGSGARLSIVRQCAGAGTDTCADTLTTEWLRDWDDVFVERGVGERRRPDIVLSRAGDTLGAIEVVVSNAVSAEKARVLSALGVPWIEVAAADALASLGAWTPNAPLPAAKLGAEYWRCPLHAAQHATLGAATSVRRTAEAEDARHATALRAARVVDVYHADGARDRFIYTISELATDGRVHSVRLKRGGLEVAMAPELAALRIAFTADLQHLARHDGSFTDSPMRWATAGAAANIVEEALIDRVGNDPTPLATTFPRRWFYNRDDRSWFLAPALRAARWDREPDDPFVAHPAWAKARAAVREHPAPEGSWTTPVFAGRPSAAMFRQSVRTTKRDATNSIAVVEIVAVDPTDVRALVVVERATSAAAVASIADDLDARGVSAVWMSHPMDWIPALAAVAWTPAGRDARGRGTVVIDGYGVFTADQFARAVSKGDRRMSASAIRASSAGRVARLRQ